MVQKNNQKTIWKIDILESGAMGSQLYVVSAGDRPLTQEQLDEAKATVDEAFKMEGKEEWLSMVCPWAGYHRFVSGLRSETRALVAALNKNNSVPKP